MERTELHSSKKAAPQTHFAVKSSAFLEFTGTAQARRRAPQADSQAPFQLFSDMSRGSNHAATLHVVDTGSPAAAAARAASWAHSLRTMSLTPAHRAYRDTRHTPGQLWCIVVRRVPTMSASVHCVRYINSLSCAGERPVLPGRAAIERCEYSLGFCLFVPFRVKRRCDPAVQCRVERRRWTGGGWF